MRHSLFTAGLAVLVGIGTMGCQSAPKLAWWKNSNKTDVQTNAVAHSAPQLPSEIARQAEGLAANPLAGNSMASTAPPYESAPPFNASKSSGASPYPSTGAPDYSGSLAQTSSAPAATASASSTMPYNPNAVPPPSYATSATSSPTPAVASVDRYGMASSASSAPTFDGGASGAASISEAAPPFASNQVASTPSPASGMASTPAAAQGNVMLSGATASSDAGPYQVGDRYATSTQSAPATMQPSSSNTPSSTSDGSRQSTSLATSEPYRPGGTSTYPSTGATQPSYEIATRPDAPASTSGGSTQQVPNVATPDSSGFQYR